MLNHSVTSRMFYPRKGGQMSFQEMLDKGLAKYKTFKDHVEIATYMQLEYIDWSYKNSDNKPEFERCLWRDVAALVA